ncbi:uncharacterized protein IUM83_07657 [Phytophthora cinnamomi]|uniref:uncharacterized protein n=1 Tax=Phytophthora cinnamomi TaxID=4785 RepID=UPI003559BE50|nr:hypothetical protein IUM83_07657 [Phytophthora cinnamomi]
MPPASSATSASAPRTANRDESSASAVPPSSGTTPASAAAETDDAQDVIIVDGVDGSTAHGSAATLTRASPRAGSQKASSGPRAKRVTRAASGSPAVAARKKHRRSDPRGATLLSADPFPPLESPDASLEDKAPPPTSSSTVAPRASTKGIPAATEVASDTSPCRPPPCEQSMLHLHGHATSDAVASQPSTETATASALSTGAAAFNLDDFMRTFRHPTAPAQP